MRQVNILQENFMTHQVRKFFQSPTLEGDPERAQDAITTHRVGVALLGLAIFSVPFIFQLESPIREIALGATILGILIWLLTIYLVKRENTFSAKIIILVINTTNLFGVVYATGGLVLSTVFTTLFLLALANLLFPKRGALVYGVILLIITSILYVMDVMNMVPAPTLENTSISNFLLYTFTIVAQASIMAIASANSQRNLEAVRRNESELLERNTELNQLKNSLEERVSERTRLLERRANQFETISNVARSIASIKSLGELLSSVARSIVESFGFYHAGVFLLDEAKEYAVLAASPTEAGRQMIANGHKLRVGEVGIVGRVAASGEPRITFDTGIDSIHFKNPLLPDTRSEMALPLKAGNNIIGVLDVQSEKPQAFDEEDIAAMQILTEQMAIAIERTRLLQQVETNLRELEHSYARATSEGWKSLIESGLLANTGYRFDNIRIQPISETPALGGKAMQTGSMVNEDNQAEPSTIALPIKIRGHAIGAVTVKLKEGYDAGTVNTLEQAIERLAGSLESARLFEEARSRADREQAISYVTTNISSATDFDTILRTTVEEVGKTLGNAEVSIQLVNEPADKLGHAED